MTELDRLHEIADDIDRTAWGRELADALHVIAAHIGEEFDHMRDLSGYESDVMAWVEAYGGLDVAKEAVETSDDYRDTLNGVCKRLDLTDGTGLPERPGTMLAELERRLMPEGMEWPRFEDNEPVRIGDHWQQDDYDESITRIDSIEFAEDGIRFENEYADTFYRYGERVKRPAPKVLDADGVEIRVGDTVWTLKGACELEVTGLYPEQDSCPVKVKEHKNGAYIFSGIDPDQLTHRPPVLAADGRPLREGETVWRVRKDMGRLEFFEYEHPWARVKDEQGEIHGLWPDDLTHERPVADTWERLEEDAALPYTEYCEANDLCAVYMGRDAQERAKASDLVRRAKKLAERGR